MKTHLTWLEGLANAAIKGLTDGFLTISGGSTFVQAISSGTVPVTGLKTIVAVSVFNAVLDSAKYVNANPFFSIPPTPPAPASTAAVS